MLVLSSHTCNYVKWNISPKLKISSPATLSSYSHSPMPSESHSARGNLRLYLKDVPTGRETWRFRGGANCWSSQKSWGRRARSRIRRKAKNTFPIYSHHLAKDRKVNQENNLNSFESCESRSALSCIFTSKLIFLRALEALWTIYSIPITTKIAAKTMAKPM